MAIVSDEPLFHDATLLDAIPTMIWITGADQQAHFFNRAWLQFTGQTLVDARQAGWAAGIHPADAAHCLATYRSSYATQQPFELEYRRHHYSGEYCWHLDRATPHFDVDGRWLGYIGTAIDITDRKLAEMALRASEEKFAKAFNASPLVITISQLVDGCLVEVNETFVQITGYTRDEVLGRTPVELGLWVEPAQRAAGLVQLQAGHALRTDEARFRMKDGQERTCLVAAERLDLNGQPCILTVLTDITDREHAEAARQVSETRYRALFETTSDAIFIGMNDGTYLDVNPAAAQLLGVPREQLIGAHYRAFIPTDWQAQATAVSGMMRASGQWAGEFPMRRADGTLVWAEYRTSFDGQYIVGVARDVTAQKQAAAETARLAGLVLAERERLANLMASVPGVVWESWGQPDDQAQRIDFVSDYVETLLGYSKAEWLATPNFWLTLVHPQDKAQAAQTVAAQFHSGRGGTNQFRWLTKDGRILDCEAIATVIHDATGQPIGMRGITFDRTTLKQSEEAYKRSAARYRALVEASSQAVWSVDLVNQTGDFAAMQHWWGELTGQSPAAIANQGWLQAVHEADRERVQRGWNELLATGASYHSEYRVYGRDGRIVYLLARAVPVRAADGTLQELVGTLTDVTEARLAEHQLRQMNETLEQRVQARTAELERRNRDLDQFAYIASHDLRSPLRAIDQLASWISQDASATLPAPSQIHLDKLRGRIKRMETLLQDLLAYSRAGRQRHAFERVDVARLVHEIAELLGLPAGFGVTVIASPPPFVVERVPLETVLRNLIGNALKHHDHPETGHVQITAQSLEDWLVFTVSDDGPGIDPAFHTRIFDLFQTLKPRDHVEGSGMGLAVVKKLVESRGGIIEVSSRVGQGATFRFTWPQVF